MAGPGLSNGSGPNLTVKEGYPMNSKSIDWNLLGFLGLMLTLLFIFWHTSFVYPVKLFVVLLHEISHGIAAFLTGGSIVRIEISADQGGLCVTRGGWRFLVLTAGYLGSMFWGGLILLAAGRSKMDRSITTLIGVVILGVTLLYIRNSFGFIYGIGFGIALLLIGWLLPNIVNDFLLKLIGLTSVLYAIFDIKDDLLTASIGGMSDATMLSREFFGTVTFWGFLWMAIALVLAYAFIRMLVIKKPSETARKTRRNPGI
jgi:hypothetical protein